MKSRQQGVLYSTPWPMWVHSVLSALLLSQEVDVYGLCVRLSCPLASGRVQKWEAPAGDGRAGKKGWFDNWAELLHLQPTTGLGVCPLAPEVLLRYIKQPCVRLVPDSNGQGFTTAPLRGDPQKQ